MCKLARMTAVSDEHKVIPAWTVGDRLRKAREHAGLDAQTFAKEIGISRNTVKGWESRDKVPQRLLLKAWALRTGVPVEWLETGESPDPGSDVNFGWSTHLADYPFCAVTTQAA